MIRPTYETAEDLAREKAVVDRLRADGLQYDKLAPNALLDYAVSSDGEIVSFLEVKCFTCTSDTHERFTLDLHKFLHIHLIHASLGIPTGVLVTYSDRAMRVWLGQYRDGSVVMTGRTDRGDPHDISPKVMIPRGEFEELWRVEN